MAIYSVTGIKKYYEKSHVAYDYIEKRFSEPIFYVEHLTQVRFINRIIREKKCSSVLEIACGPARLTKDIKVARGIAIDSSMEMLHIAKINSKNNPVWTFQKGDAFKLTFSPSSFDLVFTFRLITHFHHHLRRRIYKQIHHVLKPGGYLIFEVLNKNKVALIRTIVGRKSYPVYDKLFLKHDIVSELHTHGFDTIHLEPFISHFWCEIIISRGLSLFGLSRLATSLIKKIDHIKTSNPYGWMILCQKK